MAALGKARVQKLAPHFQGTAVINGGFEGTSVSLRHESGLNLTITASQRYHLQPTHPLRRGSSWLSYLWHGPLSARPKS